MILGFGLIAPFFIYIITGFTVQKIQGYSIEAQKCLDNFIFYVALPCLLFQSVRSIPSGTKEVLSFLSITVMVTGIMFFLGWVNGKLWGGGDNPAVYGLIGGYSNIGYMGPPLTVAILGPTAAAPAAFIFCADVLLLFSIWPAMVGQNSMSLHYLIKSLLKVMAHPFIIAVIAALIFGHSGHNLPNFINDPLNGFQKAAAPCALFSLGLTLARHRPEKSNLALNLSLFIKLFCHPILIMAIFYVLPGFNPIWVSTAIIMGALPPAANVYVMARAANQSISLAAKAVMYGTLASGITLPVVMWLLIGI
jgi:malonate transporter and related proteins|tara:strand:- start:637 stop:1557 length:921 start_codon:yes stop_codon:yes gene_type:complete